MFSSFSYNIIYQDFNELLRPLIWFGAITLFTGLGKTSILKINVAMAIITSVIVILQFLFKEQFSFIYKLYSTENLYFQTRPAGFFYTHTELPLFQLLGIYSIFKLNPELKGRNIFVVLFLFFGAAISQSKSGLLMMMIFLFGSIFINRKTIKYSYKFIFLVTFIGLSFLIIDRFDYIYYGFIDVFKMRTGNASIGNRAEDIQLVTNSFYTSPEKIFFGNGPLRAYPTISYIEITVVNVLFRFGFFGLFFYYLPLMKKYFNSPPLDKILIFSILVGDLTSNMSETLKAFPLILATLFASKKDQS